MITQQSDDKTSLIKRVYPQGTRIQLLKSVPLRTFQNLFGTVQTVVDSSHLTVLFDNGEEKTLRLKKDLFVIITKPDGSTGGVLKHG